MKRKMEEMAEGSLEMKAALSAGNSGEAGSTEENALVA